jgi:GNAT superfamily N-acetyltransferase
MPVAGVTIESASSVPWDDVRTVFGTRGDPSGCWCQFMLLPAAEMRTKDAAACSALLRDRVERGPISPGLIAYIDGEPVGWCAVEPRTSYPTAIRSRVVTRASVEPVDDPSVWAIVCFVVRVEFRRRGISTALVSAAVDWARDHGARVVEGYPVDTAKRQKASAADLYHGTVTLFESAGFDVAARPSVGRALMRLELAGASYTES